MQRCENKAVIMSFTARRGGVLSCWQEYWSLAAAVRVCVCVCGERGGLN